MASGANATSSAPMFHAIRNHCSSCVFTWVFLGPALIRHFLRDEFPGSGGTWSTGRMSSVTRAGLGDNYKNQLSS